MSWNYRVIEFFNPHDGAWQSIHEVYYDEQGRPIGYAEEPAQVVSFDDCEEIPWILDRMREALDKPVLVESDFHQKR